MQTQEFEKMFDPSTLGDFKKPIKMALISKEQEKLLNDSPKEKQVELMTKWEENMNPETRTKIQDFINALPERMKARTKRRIVKKKFGIKVI